MHTISLINAHFVTECDFCDGAGDPAVFSLLRSAVWEMNPGSVDKAATELGITRL